MQYNVYVIALKPEVLNKPKFKRATPNYINGKPCIYIGQTAKTPEDRYHQHKAGGMLSNKYVYKYHDGLRPRKYQKYNPIATREEAEKFRKKGFGVWSN